MESPSPMPYVSLAERQGWASTTIQRSWRAYTSKRIYAYFRDLISFKGTGDPAMLLKSINPTEASLLETATNSHVRFRLGGYTFPPTIYYKIFIHGAVCDLGAFSPKNYQESRRVVARHGNQYSSNRHRPNNKTKSASHSIRVGNKSFKATVKDESDIAYNRIENNGWRPVSVKVLSEAEKDPVNVATSLKSAKSPIVKLRSRKEKEKLAKRKKQEWMKKLYRSGMQQDEEDARISPDDEFENDEEEDLLEWSDNLDYDLYLEEWKRSGTSAASST